MTSLESADMTLALGAFILLFVLLFAGLPIAFGLLLIGFAGFALLQGLPAALNRSSDRRESPQ